jgi:hypothetical protein
MFDVFLNNKRDLLLVIARGNLIPAIENAGQWRKKKATIAVSNEIKAAVQRDGFYLRKLRKGNTLPNKKQKRPVTSQRPRRTDLGILHTDAGQS